jgi:tRNA-dihydrouridine synthase
MRLLALKYGADAVYSEEIIAQKIISCKRIENGKVFVFFFFE